MTEDKKIEWVRRILINEGIEYVVEFFCYDDMPECVKSEWEQAEAILSDLRLFEQCMMDTLRDKSD